MTSSPTKKKVALITGASSGIGRALATLHAQRGGDLVIVARSEPKLEALARELERDSCHVTVIPKDLAQPGAAREVHAAVSAAGVEVDYLVNNAGFGGRGAFHERRWEDDLAMINLNVIAVAELTRSFLPDFVARGRGRILNVSSTACLVPGPLQAVYYATKAFVTSFSNALAEELRGTAVTVTALMPGATETEFARVADMDRTPLFAKTTSATAVARAGYEAMLRGKMDVIAGVSLGQRMVLAIAPLSPKGMILRQVHAMQRV